MSQARRERSKVKLTASTCSAASTTVASSTACSESAKRWALASNPECRTTATTRSARATCSAMRGHCSGAIASGGAGGPYDLLTEIGLSLSKDLGG